MLTRRALILAKEESVYGSDPTPGPTTDAVLVSNPVPRVDGEILTRDYVRDSLSPLGHVIGRKMCVITFETELKGSGAAGTAPETGPLFEGCGYDETIVGSTSVTYTPLSTGHKSLTLYAYYDGLLHKITGARGTFSINMAAGQYGKISWEFTGDYVKPTDTALPTNGVFDSTLPPIIKSASFSVAAYAAIIDALIFTQANVISASGDVNAADGYGEHRIVSRDPNGSFNPETVLIATHDFWGAWEAGTKQVITITIGSTAGNIIDIDIDYAQTRSISQGDREGIIIYDMPFVATESSGDDEIEIIFT